MILWSIFWCWLKDGYVLLVQVHSDKSLHSYLFSKWHKKLNANILSGLYLAVKSPRLLFTPKIRMQISGHRFEARSVFEEAEHTEAAAAGGPKHGTPLQPFLTNLTYAALCTITSFEAPIKAASSSRARKQKWKQRNKLFCSDPSLMCIPPNSPSAHHRVSASWLHTAISLFSFYFNESIQKICFFPKTFFKTFANNHSAEQKSEMNSTVAPEIP